MIIKVAPHSSHMAIQRLRGVAAEILTEVRALRLVFIEGP
jgi:hypothetical protein